MYLYVVCCAVWWVSGAFSCIRLKAFSAFSLLSLSNGHQRGSIGMLPLSALLALSDTQRQSCHVIQYVQTTHASYHIQHIPASDHAFRSNTSYHLQISNACHDIDIKRPQRSFSTITLLWCLWFFVLCWQTNTVIQTNLYNTLASQHRSVIKKMAI